MSRIPPRTVATFLAAMLLGSVRVISAADPGAFSIQAVADRPDANTVTVSYAPKKGPAEDVHLIQGALLDGSHVASATVRKGDDGAELLIALTPTGAERFTEATTHNLGKRLAILIDGTLQSMPVVREPITSTSSVLSGLSAADAHAFAAKLNQRP